jgi:hypothetical protein
VFSERFGRLAEKAAADGLRSVRLEEVKHPQKMDRFCLWWDEFLLFESTPDRVADQRAATEEGFPISNVLSRSQLEFREYLNFEGFPHKVEARSSNCPLLNRIWTSRRSRKTSHHGEKKRSKASNAFERFERSKK